MDVQPAVTPADDEVGVAVIGAGYWGPNLIRNFMSCPSAWLWTVCDLDVERAAHVVGKRSSIGVTADLDEVLADPRIEAVAIATPAVTHLPIALAALEAGKHVLVEKPLALTSADARQITRAADAAGLVAMCDHTFCYTPAVNRIRSEIAGGNLGRIQYIDSVRINLGIVQPDIDVFWDLLPHDLSILGSVLPGDCAPIAVSALGVDPIGAGKPCVGYVTLMLPDDAIAHVHVSWLSPVKIRNVVFGGSERHLVWNDTNPAQRISTYERGVHVARIDDSEEQREVMVQYRSGDMHAPALVETEALQALVRDFATCIRDGGTPLTSGWSGVRVLEILEAVDASQAASGALVPIPGAGR
jgi:predicted dehydrogenase